MAVSAAHAVLAAGGSVDNASTAGEARRVAEAVLLSYAQLLFSRSTTVGAALFAATLTAPLTALVGLASVLLAMGTANALRLPPEQIRSGQLSYNALMVGMAISVVAPLTPATAGVIAVAVVASVLFTAALHLAIGVGYGLPVLTMPFLAVFYLAHGGTPAIAHHAVPAVGLFIGYLRALGSILCVPSAEAGAVVLCALLLHSRIAAALSLASFALVWWVAPAMAPTLGLNAMLVAMALGSVWFIPSAGSYALGLVGAAVASVLSAGLAARFERLGLPLLIVPFNLTVPLVLYVMRQRVTAGAPHPVDFTPGTPEQNLAYFRSRNERFGSVVGIRVGPPFRGRWVCTQGVNGGITHEGPWRHALDFEVRNEEGFPFYDDGDSLSAFACYHLPVVACAAGVVAKVVDGIADNPVGEVNLEDNWGNVVIVYHAPGVYSCVAHLSPGTISVREGQHVQAGELLGLCGNSGRSAVPHLHFQLQATAEVGAATIPMELHDSVVVGRTESRLHAAHVPTRGEVIRGVTADEDRAKLLRFDYRQPLQMRHAEGRGFRTEEVIPDIDLLGRCVLRSANTDAVLYYEHSPAGFTVHDVTGDPGSVLHLLRASLSRVPFDGDGGLVWSDRLPLRSFLPVWMRPLFDLASPLGGPSSLTMFYTARREGMALLVEGRSDRCTRDGRPWVQSTVCLVPNVGAVCLELAIRGRTHRVEVDPAARPFDVFARQTLLPSDGGSSHEDQRKVHRSGSHPVVVNPRFTSRGQPRGVEALVRPRSA